LLEHGADADHRNDRGQTPLGGAAFKGYEEIIAALLEHGADIDADNGGGMTVPSSQVATARQGYTSFRLKLHCSGAL